MPRTADTLAAWPDRDTVLSLDGGSQAARQALLDAAAFDGLRDNYLAAGPAGFGFEGRQHAARLLSLVHDASLSQYGWLVLPPSDVSSTLLPNVFFLAVAFRLGLPPSLVASIRRDATRWGVCNGLLDYTRSHQFSCQSGPRNGPHDNLV